MQHLTKSEAWAAGYAKGFSQGKLGFKGLVGNPYMSTDLEKAWFEGFGFGINDAHSCGKVDRSLENPYEA